MKILIATDAWHPQVNGVVRTLTSLARSASALGADIGFLTPDGFPSMALPTYPGLRIALPNRREIARRIEQAVPDAIHIARSEERRVGKECRYTRLVSDWSSDVCSSDLQVNGVVRTLTSLARSASALGADIGFLTPDGFPSMALPTYPGLRIALPNRREIARRIEQAVPDAIHIA